jgi:antitoxin (DNA-binding transcriptional repressor) of toxin-antitoxin stability system
VSVHVPRRMRDDLERLARDRGVSLGELVRQAISELLTRVQNGELVINTEGINPSTGVLPRQSPSLSVGWTSPASYRGMT